VLVCDMNQKAIDAGRAGMEASLDRAVRGSKLDAAARDDVLARVTFTTDLGDLADRQLAVRKVGTKIEHFRHRDAPWGAASPGGKCAPSDRVSDLA